MTVELYNVDGLVVRMTEITCERTRAIVRAMNRNPQFELDKVTSTGDKHLIKCTVKCNGVPSRNPFGIKYNEPLAIEIDQDYTKLPNVLSLGIDFPVLMHQNHVLDNSPRSLCLYFEPSIVVFRTWTPQKLLRRIVWWLERSAQGNLHPADQAVEQVFFTSPFEIILPNQLRSGLDNTCKLGVVNRFEREGSSHTFIVDFLRDKNDQANIPIDFIYYQAQPIVHGEVFQFPSSFESLIEFLESKGNKPREFFQNYYNNLVNENGTESSTTISLTILLLRIPVQRDSGSPIERNRIYACMLDGNKIDVGEKSNFLFKLDGKYYRNSALGGEDDLPPAHISAQPISVLFKNSKLDYRNQSGLTPEDGDPKSLLIGAGALGSSLFDIWCRSGWGEWSVVDKDHLKPHNLTRHIAYDQAIGLSKSRLLNFHYKSVTGSRDCLTTYETDALEISGVDMANAMNDNDFVVDISTTIEYPRLSSVIDDLPRHCSAFITPNGNDVVLSIEDSERTLRLLNIESQYYRAILNNSWGDKHLQGHLGSYWSGAGCRDISFKLAYSRVLECASLLSEKIRSSYNNQKAALQIWHTNPCTLAREHFEITLHAANNFVDESKSFYLDEGLIEKVRRLRNDYSPNETGGILLGYHDFNINAVVIVDALEQPSDSTSTPRQFIRGVDGVLDSMKRADDLTGGNVCYIGEWHSHPGGLSAHPSPTDYIQLDNLAADLSIDGMPAVSLIVAKDDISICLLEAPSSAE